MLSVSYKKHLALQPRDAPLSTLAAVALMAANLCGDALCALAFLTPNLPASGACSRLSNPLPEPSCGEGSLGLPLSPSLPWPRRFDSPARHGNRVLPLLGKEEL